MTTEGIASFLEQIKEAKRNVEQWPQWMRDSTRVVTAPVPDVAPNRDGDGEQGSTPEQ